MGLISALAIDPANSKILYATGDENHTALFISRDGGKTWERHDSLPEIPRRIWVDNKSPGTRARSTWAETHFVLVKDSSGLHRYPAPTGVTFTDISAGFTSGTEPTIYAVSQKGAFVSQDSGKTWRTTSLPGSGAKVRAIATSRQNGKVAYISYSDMLLDGKTWMGVAKTDNAGQSWQLEWRESDTAARERARCLDHSAVSELSGAKIRWNSGVADQDPNLAYATDLGRTMKTADGGATWCGDVFPQSAFGRRGPPPVWMSQPRTAFTLIRSTPSGSLLLTPISVCFAAKMVARAGRVPPRRSAGMGQHDVLGGLRSESARPHVEREQ